MKLQQLKYIWEVTTTTSMSRVAKACLPQPGISKQIRLLEDGRGRGTARSGKHLTHIAPAGVIHELAGEMLRKATPSSRLPRNFLTKPAAPCP